MSGMRIIPFQLDKDKLTFITPWGRYRYLRAPRVWIYPLQENLVLVCKLLDIYGKSGLVMNSVKIQFRPETGSFTGMDFTKDQAS